MSQQKPPFPFLFGANGASSAPNSAAQQQSSTPTANMQPQSQIQSAQQAAFQHNAQIPGVDMSLLQGVSPQQLALIAQLVHSGALNVPPQAPAPAASAFSQASAPATVLSKSPNVPTVQAPAGSVALNQDFDMDREDGELRESEVDTTPVERGFLHPPPTGPRSRSISPRRPLVTHQQQTPQPRAQHQSQKTSKKQQSALQQQQEVPSKVPQDDHRTPMKMFVEEMVKSGATYDQMVAEVGNGPSLTRMFKELGLSLSSGENLDKQSRVNGTSNSFMASKPPHHQEPRVASVPKRAAPAKPTAQNRDEYLAKLQAAKNRKAEGASAISVTPSVVTGPVNASSSPSTTANPLPHGALDTSSKPGPPKTAVVQTELIRQRLEALKAKNAAAESRPPHVASSPMQKPTTAQSNLRQAASSPPQSGLGAGLGDIPSKISQTSLPTQSAGRSFNPTPPTPSRSFSGLPGLFMTDTSHPPATATSVSGLPLQQQPTLPVSSGTLAIVSTPSPGALTMSRKRPVASDFDDVSGPSGTVKRPFGQSRNASEDESLIIEVSDDDEEDGEVEADNGVGLGTPVGSQTKPFRDAGPLRNFPPRPMFHTTSSSPTVPGVSTPGGIAYEQNLMKDIEDMKRMIAEKEKKKNTNGKVATATPNGSAKVITSADNGPSSLNGVSEPVSQPSPSTHSVAPETRQHEKEQLSQRLTELRQQELQTDGDANRSATGFGTALHADLSNALSPVDFVQSADDVEEPSGIVASASEDDENFYEMPDAHETEQQEPAYPNKSIVDSQATTASATNISETHGISLETTPSHETESQAGGDEHAQAMKSTMAEANGADDTKMLPPVETQPVLREDSMESGEVDSHDETMQDNALRSDIDDEDVEMDDEDQDEDEDEDEVDDDLYDAGKDADPTLPESPDDHEAEEGEVLSDSEGSDSSSGEVQNYEPELHGSDPSTPADGIGNDGKLAAISSVSGAEAAGQGHLADDDLASELQPDEQQLDTAHEQQVDTAIQDEYRKSYYTAYESPLRIFRSYKYHSDYLDTVSDGFKSLTYNNNIDPVQPLCRFETAGGVCNDPACESQHWKSMGLTDAALLNTMALEHRPNSDPEKTMWNNGLAAVIKDLKSNKTNDAATIAAKIAEFKRDFQGDPTKVLRLA